MTASITDDRRSSTGFFLSDLSDLLDGEDDDDCRLGLDPAWPSLSSVGNESCTVDLKIRDDDDDDDDAIVLRARRIAMASAQLGFQVLLYYIQLQLVSGIWDFVWRRRL